MHELLNKALQRAGVDNVSELSDEEKVDYDKYARILDKPELSLDDLVTFCLNEKKTVEGKFGNDELSPDTMRKLIVAHNILSKFIWFITGDKAERETAIRELTSAWNL